MLLVGGSGGQIAVQAVGGAWRPRSWCICRRGGRASTGRGWCWWGLAASRLKILEMGDDVAGGLGVPVQRTRLLMLVPATADWAVATAAAGPIPLVALTASQPARRLTRVPGPNLQAATCTGALLVVTADFASQRIHASAQLPVGVVTAVVGGVYLGLLPRRQRRGADLRPQCPCPSVPSSCVGA